MKDQKCGKRTNVMAESCLFHHVYDSVAAMETQNTYYVYGFIVYWGHTQNKNEQHQWHSDKMDGWLSMYFLVFLAFVNVFCSM